MKPIAIIILILLAWPAAGPSEYYKYRDENGVLRFSDTFPETYTGSVEVYQDSISTPPPQVEKQKPRKQPTVKAAPEKPGPKLPETEFTLLKNRILLPVEIVGTRGKATVNLVLDTGAQRTFLWRTALPSIGLRRIGRIRAAGIAGSKYVSAVKAKSIMVGPYRIPNIEMAVMSPGRYQKNYDGLLGMDFLMNVKYEIDYKRRVIVWKGVN